MLYSRKSQLVTESSTNSTYASEPTVEDIAVIVESIIMENLSQEEILQFLGDQREQTNSLRDEVLMEKSIVRLDKHAKLSRAQKMAVFTIAKEKKDPMFRKLLTIWKIERELESRLLKKYGSEGMRRAQQAVNKSMNSTSNIIKKAATKAKRTLNAPVV